MLSLNPGRFLSHRLNQMKHPLPRLQDHQVQQMHPQRLQDHLQYQTGRQVIHIMSKHRENSETLLLPLGVWPRAHLSLV